jgi:hypothetical protein
MLWCGIDANIQNACRFREHGGMQALQQHRNSFFWLCKQNADAATRNIFFVGSFQAAKEWRT